MIQLSQAIAQTEALLLEASLNPSLETNLSIAFGDNYNVTVADNIFSSWRNQDFSNLPKIVVLSPTEINGAQGAYSALNNTIYLSSFLLESQSVTVIRDVIIEEIGHFIDAQINDIDSPGDEGEIWRNLVLNQAMTETELNNLKTQNDWNTITVNGQIFNVENSGIIKITNNSTEDFNPQISGNNVVWSGWDGNDYEIYFYNGTSTIQLTNNNTNDDNPQISGNNVVWIGSSDNFDPPEIYFYNGNTTQLSSNTFNVQSPQISGSNVVWYGFDGNDNEIYLYNGNTTTQLTNNDTQDSDPQISGNNIVWRSFDGNDSEIYFYNGNTITQLTNNTTEDFAPQISGNNVVWRGFDGNDSEIYFYNGNTTTQLTNNTTDELEPQISGNNVVWKGFDGNDYEIYFYNGSTTTQLTNNTTDDFAPQISGNNVVWYGWDGNDYEIYTYQIGSLLLGDVYNNNLVGTTGNDTIQGLAGNDTLQGLNGNDLLEGGIGADSIIGGIGTDTLNGGAGADTMRGGLGNDTYYVDNTGDRVVENADSGIDTVRSTITYTLGNNLENLILEGTANINGTGNTLNNSITGNSSNNILNGGDGNDTLIGGNGNDTIIGGAGNDSLTGGSGNDFFRFNSPSEGIDRITDFNVVDDTILISRSGFGGGLPLGELSANRFRIGSSASTPDHRFFYNTNNGGLFFDVDGNGATSAVRIATLNTGLAMTNADIVVI
ncbi:hypothetical protein ACN4EE_17780 [Geminocystis sp. CENA526]|uniref:hypothetical protein n=1 Tax=Geminocystis sp. CENA526 TaxID=1355871 RepID=UPI003D6E7FB0